MFILRTINELHAASRTCSNITEWMVERISHLASAKTVTTLYSHHL